MIVEKRRESKVFDGVWERNLRKERENLPKTFLFFLGCTMWDLGAFILEI